MMGAHLLATSDYDEENDLEAQVQTEAEEHENYDESFSGSSQDSSSALSLSSNNMISLPLAPDVSKRPDEIEHMDNEDRQHVSASISVTDDVRVRSGGRTIHRKGDERERYRGESPQVVRTRRSFHDACQSRKSDLRMLQEMLATGPSLAWIAVSTRPSVKALVPMQILSSNFDFILKYAGQTSLDSFILELFRLYPNALTRRDQSQRLPFFGALIEWFSKCPVIDNISKKSTIESNIHSHNDVLVHLSSFSLHILSLLFDSLEKVDSDDDTRNIESEIIDEFIPLVPCLFRAITGVKEEKLRHKLFHYSIVRRVLVACAPDCFENGKHSLHLLSESASLLASQPDDLNSIVRDLVMRSPMVVVVADKGGRIPFESNIRQWVSSHMMTSTDSTCGTESTSESQGISSSKVSMKCSNCSCFDSLGNELCHRDMQFTLHLLSKISTEFLPEAISSSASKEVHVSTVLSVLVKTLASIPFFTLSLLATSKLYTDKVDLFNFSIVSNILNQPEHVQDGWLIKMFNQGMVDVVALYLEKSSQYVSIEKLSHALVHNHDFFELAIQSNYKENVLIRSGVFRHILDHALFFHVSIMLTVLELLFMVLTLVGHGLYVDGWIQNDNSKASLFFFPTIIFSLYFLCRALGSICHNISRQNMSWGGFDVLGSSWLICSLLTAESLRGRLNEPIQVCLAISSLYLWIKFLAMVEVFSARMAFVRRVVLDIVNVLIPFAIISFFVLVSFSQILYITASSKSKIECGDGDSLLCDKNYHFLSSLSFALGTFTWNDYRNTGASVFFVVIFALIFASLFFGALSHVAKYAYEHFRGSEWLNDEHNRFTYCRLRYIHELQSYERVLREGIKLDFTRLTLNNFTLLASIFTCIVVESLAVIQFKGSTEELFVGSLMSNFGVILALLSVSLASRIPPYSLLNQFVSSFVLPFIHLPKTNQQENCVTSNIVKENESVETSLRTMIKNELKRSEKRYNLILKSEMEDYLSKMELGVSKKYDVGSI